jgi:ABC-2 type transport system ATP-binding protein
MTQRLIEIKKITKKYKADLIFRNISYTVLEKRNLGIIGLNGSGKTTLLNVIANLEKSTSGEIKYFPTILKRHRLDIDIVQQYFMYNRNDTVSDFVNLTCGLYRLKINNVKKTKIYNFFGIYRLMNSKFTNLSGGQKKIVEIFCSLFHNPKIVIFDELLKELDLDKQQTYLKFIKQYCNKNNITILFTAHNYLELEYLAGDILLIENKKGRIITLPPSPELRTNKIKSVIRRTFVKANRNWNV